MTTTMHEELDGLAAAVATLLETPIVMIRSLDGRGLVLEGAHGLAGGWRDHPDVGPTCCREVAVTGRPLIVHDARKRMSALARAGWGFDTGSYAGVPIMARAACVGTLAAITNRPRAWQSRDLTVLRGFATAVAAVFEARHARRQSDEIARTLQAERAAFESRRAITASTHNRITGELAVIAVHDELTGLLNRRGFFASAETQIAALRRDATPGVLLFIDVDGLKRTNDCHGHAAGDTLLREAARFLQSSFGVDDTIARLGGDEFCVIAASHDPDVVSITGRLSVELERANADLRVPIAWSIGAARIEPDRPRDIDSLLHEADRQMYWMKGRQVAVGE